MKGGSEVSEERRARLDVIADALGSDENISWTYSHSCSTRAEG